MLNCPYCNAKLDEWDLVENPKQDENVEIMCPECNKIFRGHCVYELTIEAFTADCLNNLCEHKWKDSCRLPKIIDEMKKQYCIECNRTRERKVSQEEIEEYIKKYPKIKEYQTLEKIIRGE